MTDLTGRPAGLVEVRDLEKGMDFRLPEYRREVFLRFYEFSSRYKSFPGCVYYLIPALADLYGWSDEEKLWFAFINGNTQNPVTSLLIMKIFRDASTFLLAGGEQWFNTNWKNLDWDTDRRYQKKEFPSNVEWYWNVTKNGQFGFFKSICNTKDEQENFRLLWDEVRNNFPSFGRLSAFSYTEYLKIVGLPIDCDNLFLEDISGSASHRNGLAIVLGRDDLDFHHETAHYTKAQMSWLKEEAALLLAEAKERVPEASYFTLESALCTYKSWHRPNRRYPNVYNDMLYSRIKSMEGKWNKDIFQILWNIRKTKVHPYLLCEENQVYPASDAGLATYTQNWYRETGQVIFMDLDWECFSNDFWYNYKLYQNRNNLQQVGVADSRGGAYFYSRK